MLSSIISNVYNLYATIQIYYQAEQVDLILNIVTTEVLMAPFSCSLKILLFVCCCQYFLEKNIMSSVLLDI